MFIVHESNYIGLKPHRGDMAWSDLSHAAPTELEPFIGGTGAINRSLLRSWPEVAACQDPERDRTKFSVERMAAGAAPSQIRECLAAAIAHLCR